MFLVGGWTTQVEEYDGQTVASCKGVMKIGLYFVIREYSEIKKLPIIHFGWQGCTLANDVHEWELRISAFPHCPRPFPAQNHARSSKNNQVYSCDPLAYSLTNTKKHMIFHFFP